MFPGPNAQIHESSASNIHCHTYKTPQQDIFNSADRLGIDGPSKSDGIDNYEESSGSQIQSSYDTYASFTSSIDYADSDNSLVPYANTTTYLNGIGQWVEDHSSSGSTWTAWQNPDVLIQHASRFNIASNMLKPHVEEAMNYFQASFYGIGGAGPEYHRAEHQ